MDNNREVYFVGGPMNGKSLVRNNDASVYLAPIMPKLADFYYPSPEVIPYDDYSVSTYMYDIVRSQYGTEITWYGIGREFNMNILAAFQAQNNLLKEIQDSDQYWEERLKASKSKKVIVKEIPNDELITAIRSSDAPLQSFTQGVAFDSDGNLVSEMTDDKWQIVKEESDWDKKLKEELNRGDDTWGSIAKRYKK